MSDYLMKALAYDGQIRAYAISSTELVSEAQRRHDTWPTASAALGRALTATTMMGATLKGNDKVTVKIEGGGPLGVLIIDANAVGEVRGYVTNPHVHFDLNEHGKLDVARAVGKNGFLSVVKDLGLKDMFTGQVPLVSGELGDDFTYYYVTSEQIPSSVGVGVLVNPDNSILAAGGFMFQVLPEAEEEVIALLEKRLETISPISTMIHNGLTPEEILFEILGKENVTILEKMAVSFKCNCSLERTERAIIGLGKEEIRAMIDEDGQAETVCHFCNQAYHFDKTKLEKLFQISK
ncbi:Hsp33 family molecular chaperone HslO [Pueribacillus sp. YX66]|uniref:Hsp33 family molecular chaperone HslO n=1 Tax=Pueribacillus sp. YX66 TaxID=3229242 RepID=UPI00358D6DF9